MDFLLADALFWIMGVIFLFIRYGNRKKVIAVRNNEFDGSYTEAGRSIAFSTLLTVTGIAIFSLLLGIYVIS